MMHDFWKILLFDMFFCFVFVLNIFHCLDQIGVKYLKRTKRIILCYAVIGVIPLHAWWAIHLLYFSEYF